LPEIQRFEPSRENRSLAALLEHAEILRGSDVPYLARVGAMVCSMAECALEVMSSGQDALSGGGAAG
jgi:hypothetical protein